MIGKIVECHEMPEGSFYNAVRGELVEVKNGWASIRATEVIDRWNILFQKHPSSCMTSARVENIKLAA